MKNAARPWCHDLQGMRQGNDIGTHIALHIYGQRFSIGRARLLLLGAYQDELSAAGSAA
jgi:hypothetical protein